MSNTNSTGFTPLEIEMAKQAQILDETIYQNPYIPKIDKVINGKHVEFPSPKQTRFLAYMGREALFGGAAGSGKALCATTLIPVPNGWKTIGDLLPGDQVFDRNGKPTDIVAVSSVMIGRDCWQLTFDDGSTIVADADHEWLTFSASELAQLTRLDPAWRAKRRARRKSRSCVGAGTKWNHTPQHRLFLSQQTTERNQRTACAKVPYPQGTIRTTATIAATLTTRDGSRANHAVPVGQALELPPAELPLDPYVLGLWLGDGHRNGAGFTSADEEIIGYIRAAGWPVRKVKSAYGWNIGTRSFGKRAGTQGDGLINDFCVKLRALGIFDNKHIPPMYLRASREQRLALLRGLMDTDGTASPDGRISFTNTNRAIAFGVYELICSLGWKAGISESRAMLYDKDCGPVWDIHWTPNESVFRLKRKKKRERSGRIPRRTTNYRYIVKCEPVESVPVKCIQVAAADGIFLAGTTMIPTHNSRVLLAAALQYVHNPDYHALLLRRTFPQLMMDGGLIPMSKEWLHGKAHWSSDNKRWTFPSGATLSFNYYDHDNHYMNFQGGAWSYVGFDELTQFKEKWYRYLFSRQRRLEGSPIPIRMRAASNPGGPLHEFVKRRFVVPGAPKFFVPALIDDNKGLDKVAYVRSLAELDPTTRKQLLQGDWDAYEGGRFKSEWFLGTDGNRGFWIENRRGHLFYRWTNGPAGGIPVDLCWTFIICDPAARAEEANDHTAMIVFAVMPHGEVLILEVVREHLDIEAIAPRMAQLCATWQPLWVGVENTGFQIAVMRSLQKHPGIPSVQGLEPEGKSKLVRATPAIIAASEGRIYVPIRGPMHPWIEDFLSELSQFTGTDEDSSDDMVDCLAYGILALARHGLTAPTIITPEQAQQEIGGHGQGIFMR